MESGSILKIEPIEFATQNKYFDIIEPCDGKNIRQYIPSSKEFCKPNKIQFSMQKYGILELCEDIIGNINNSENTIMPSLDESLNQLNWLINACN